jgi:hypothetical protein
MRSARRQPLFYGWVGSLFLRLGMIAGGTHSRLQAFNHHASLSF